MAITKQSLCSAATTTGAKTAVQIKNQPPQFKKVVVAYGTTGSGTGSATILVQGSLEGTHYVDLGTISLTLGTTETTGKVETEFPYDYIRVNISALSGIGASITADVGF